MSKEENDDLVKLDKNDFEIPINYSEEVPYLNNDSDEIQDILKKARNITIGLQKDMTKNINNNNSNVLNVTFNKNNKK